MFSTFLRLPTCSKFRSWWSCQTSTCARGRWWTQYMNQWTTPINNLGLCNIRYSLGIILLRLKKNPYNGYNIFTHVQTFLSMMVCPQCLWVIGQWSEILVQLGPKRQLLFGCCQSGLHLENWAQNVIICLTYYITVRFNIVQMGSLRDASSHWLIWQHARNMFGTCSEHVRNMFGMLKPGRKPDPYPSILNFAPCLFQFFQHPHPSKETNLKKLLHVELRKSDISMVIWPLKGHLFGRVAKPKFMKDQDTIFPGRASAKKNRSSKSSQYIVQFWDGFKIYI